MGRLLFRSAGPILVALRELLEQRAGWDRVTRNAGPRRAADRALPWWFACGTRCWRVRGWPLVVKLRRPHQGEDFRGQRARFRRDQFRDTGTYRTRSYGTAFGEGARHERRRPVAAHGRGSRRLG